jgi:hypothetical protein
MQVWDKHFWGRPTFRPTIGEAAGSDASSENHYLVPLSVMHSTKNAASGQQSRQRTPGA